MMRLPAMAPYILSLNTAYATRNAIIMGSGGGSRGINVNPSGRGINVNPSAMLNMVTANVTSLPVRSLKSPSMKSAKLISMILHQVLI